MNKEINVDEIIARAETVINRRLIPISVRNVRRLRKTMTPYFILKIENKYFYAKINEDLTFYSKGSRIFDHMCNADCARMYARGEEEGGCSKIRDIDDRIEYYDWIRLGFETINTKITTFVVGQCDHYQKAKPRKKYTPAEKKIAKISLAQFMYEDIETLEDINRYKARNHMRYH